MNHADRLVASDTSSSSPDPGQLSGVLLRIYDAANAEDVPAFQDCAMGILNEVIPFGGSWWGSGVGPAAGYQVHGSHLRNLPADLPQLHNIRGSENPLARASADSPNRAFLFTADMLYSGPTVAALSEYMHAHESLCITQIDDRVSGSLRFLVITREAQSAPFRKIDQQWLEWINPHLNAALDLCCRVQMARWRRVHDYGGLLAISDAKGFLHLSEPGVAQLLSSEWPDWTGSQLPDAVVALLADGSTACDGRKIMIDFRWLGERVLLSIRSRHLFDDLSPQERATSLAFASGDSYKVVARKIGIAPATVRHHLRSAYAKLGVSDKAALAQLAKSIPLAQAWAQNRRGMVASAGKGRCEG